MRPSQAGYSLLLLASLSCCAPAGGKAPDHPNRVILPSSEASALLKQCSRSAPLIGEAEWQPRDADIDSFEKILPKILAAAPEAREVNFSDVLNHWKRQYVGLVRDGKRFIYGNFFPAEDNIGFEEWRTKPMIVCDGGGVFFGAEFDVGSNRVTRVDFNGGVGG